MPVERAEISPRMALGVLKHVHRRHKPPSGNTVVRLAQEMLAADDAGETWAQGELRRVVFSAAQDDRPAGVIRGVEVLLAVVYTNTRRSLLVEHDAPLAAYLDEVDPETGPVIAGNGVPLDSHLTIGTWADDHQP